MADDKVAVAVDEVAKRVVARLLRWALESENAYEKWEDYPLIGEHDWGAVEYRIKQLADDIDPDDAVFDAAYEFLAGRAEQ